MVKMAGRIVFSIIISILDSMTTWKEKGLSSTKITNFPHLKKPYTATQRTRECLGWGRTRRRGQT